MAPLNKKKRKIRKEKIPEIEIIRTEKTSAPASSDNNKKKRKKMPKTAPGQEIFFVDMEQIKYIESNHREFTLLPNGKNLNGERRQEGVSILKFIPSKTNQEEVAFEFYPSKDFNQEDLFTKNINPHIEAIQKLINTSFNFVRNYEFLMDSANEVLRILHWYLGNTKSPRFHWGRNAYSPPFRSPDVVLHQLPKAEDCVNICKLAENGCVSLYPDSPRISEADHPTADRGHALTQPMLDQNIPPGYRLPLNEKERKIWLDFKKSDKGNPESVLVNFTFEDEKRSIILSDPLVNVIGGFAVAAFNKACAMHFKKDEQNNLHDFEYMECKYVKDTKDYFFYMTIEAIEEGNLGVYEAIVVCSRDDGNRTLLKFVLTDRTPVGMKAMAISLFSCLISLLKTLEIVGRNRLADFLACHYVARGVFQGMAAHEGIFFGHSHHETVKGIRRVISLNLQLLFQPDCTRTTNPDAWYVPDPDLDTGMKPRSNGTPCRGYDYNHYNQFLMGRCF